MALLLTGMTCSGKDTVAKILMQKYGMDKFVTYTTRPMRDGEVEGIDYYYLTKEEFLKKEKEGFFDETTFYRVASGDIWYYGSNGNGITNNTVMIVNPDGWRTYCGRGITFYLTCEQDERLRRLYLRGDNPEEAKRRLYNDAKDFRYFEGYAEFTIDTTNLTSEEVAEKIYSIYKEN